MKVGSVLSNSEVILRCMDTNVRYMATTPAGKAGYPAVVRLYQRIAKESLDCAAAWVAGNPCPPHEPATSAFWWGVAAWASDFTRDVLSWHSGGQPLPGRGVLFQELQDIFCRPHREFAQWLKPRSFGTVISLWDFADTYEVDHIGSPARIILLHDAAWTAKVMRLTARWGLVHHLKDLPALVQGLLLMRRLKRPGDPVGRAYLDGDLVFLKELFGHFPFTPQTQAVLDHFLEDALEPERGWLAPNQ